MLPNKLNSALEYFENNNFRTLISENLWRVGEVPENRKILGRVNIFIEEKRKDYGKETKKLRISQINCNS